MSRPFFPSLPQPTNSQPKIWLRWVIYHSWFSAHTLRGLIQIRPLLWWGQATGYLSPLNLVRVTGLHHDREPGVLKFGDQLLRVCPRLWESPQSWANRDGQSRGKRNGHRIQEPTSVSPLFCHTCVTAGNAHVPLYKPAIIISSLPPLQGCSKGHIR